jgi:toxin ParE1/3/4
MNIRWSPEAAADFAGIVEYIHQHNPSAADRVANSIYDSITSLDSFPSCGRQGRVRGTRELALPSLPVIVVYSVQ